MPPALPLDPSRILVVDIEASALHGGYPIEIAWAWLVGGDVQSSLIRPVPEWTALHWAPEAERLHGIARRALGAAPPATEVARRCLAVMESADRVISDAPVYDLPWLEELTDLIELEPPPVHESLPVFVELTGVPADDIVALEKTLGPPRHRAGADVERLRRLFDAILA